MEVTRDRAIGIAVEHGLQPGYYLFISLNGEIDDPSVGYNHIGGWVIGRVVDRFLVARYSMGINLRTYKPSFR